MRRLGVGKAGRGGTIEECGRTMFDHARDLCGNRRGVAGIDGEPEAVVACQASDQPEILRQHRPARARGPQQHAARSDEALVGRQHDVAAADQLGEFAVVEPPGIEAQPQGGLASREDTAPVLETAGDGRVDFACQQDPRIAGLLPSTKGKL